MTALLTVLTYLLIYFIHDGGSRYLEPLEVRNPSCGLAGEVAGVTVDDPAAPTTVTWQDPYFPGTHCTADIRALVAPFPVGTRYLIGTTVMGEIGTADFNLYPDPHVTEWATIGVQPPPPPPPPPPPACPITIRIETWTASVPIGGRGKVLLQLANPQPIVRLQVKLGTQVIGEVTGTDLRDLAGLYFSVPRTPGSYNITVAAQDATCTAQTTNVRVVTVQ